LTPVLNVFKSFHVLRSEKGDKCEEKKQMVSPNQVIIFQAVCPFCREPSNLAEDDDIALAYYAQLDILLKAVLLPLNQLNTIKI
jgi:hypothetical protein